MPCTILQQLLAAPDKNACFSLSSSAQEHGKKFRFDNQSGKAICRVKVDGCLITSQETKKCDYLFSVSEGNKYYLIELKGVAVDDAVVQIIRTFDIVNSKIKAEPEHYKGIIVSSAVPSATEQRFRRLQDKCYREKRLKITKTHIQHIERV
jgi:hypothetical protein